MLILCAGMIRSGSTLQYNLVRSLLEKTGNGAGEGFVADTDSAESLKRFRDWAGDAASHAVKIHRIPSELDTLLAETNTRVCYIYRDIRDVAVSLKHKHGRLAMEMAADLDGAVAAYEAIINQEPVLRQRYEKVIGDTECAARELAAFLGLSLSEVLLREAVEENSLERAQKRITRNPIHNLQYLARRISRALGGKAALRRIGTPEWILRRLPRLRLPKDAETLLHRNHISKNRGACGVWRKDLDKTEIAFLNARYGTWLKSAGYETG